MALTSGSGEIAIGVVDSPVAINHPDLDPALIRGSGANAGRYCAQPHGNACMHGTFVAGILAAKRGARAPAICPNCTLLVYPIFADTAGSGVQMPSATPEELATAVVACVAAGARLLNLSLSVLRPSASGERALQDALDLAAQRGLIVVAAAGNHGSVGASAITGHPWVIAVAACNRQGRPLNFSNLGRSIGRHGISAPGHEISSLGAGNEPMSPERNQRGHPLCDRYDRATVDAVSDSDRQ